MKLLLDSPRPLDPRPRPSTPQSNVAEVQLGCGGASGDLLARTEGGRRLGERLVFVGFGVWGVRLVLGFWGLSSLWVHGLGVTSCGLMHEQHSSPLFFVGLTSGWYERPSGKMPHTRAQALPVHKLSVLEACFPKRNSPWILNSLLQWSYASPGAAVGGKCSDRGRREAQQLKLSAGRAAETGTWACFDASGVFRV